MNHLSRVKGDLSVIGQRIHDKIKSHIKPESTAKEIQAEIERTKRIVFAEAVADTIKNGNGKVKEAQAKKAVTQALNRDLKIINKTLLSREKEIVNKKEEPTEAEKTELKKIRAQKSGFSNKVEGFIDWLEWLAWEPSKALKIALDYLGVPNQNGWEHTVELGYLGIMIMAGCAFVNTFLHTELLAYIILKLSTNMLWAKVWLTFGFIGLLYDIYEERRENSINVVINTTKAATKTN